MCTNWAFLSPGPPTEKLIFRLVLHHITTFKPWWHYVMKTLSALLTLVMGIHELNSPTVSHFRLLIHTKHPLYLYDANMASLYSNGAQIYMWVTVHWSESYGGSKVAFVMATKAINPQKVKQSIWILGKITTIFRVNFFNINGVKALEKKFSYIWIAPSYQINWGHS